MLKNIKPRIAIISIAIIALIGLLIAVYAKEKVNTISNDVNTNTSVSSNSPLVSITPQPMTNEQAETMKIVIYHASSDGMYLVPEIHNVAKNDQPALTALNLLINGTTDKNLKAVLPADVKIRDVTVKNYTAYVDFSAKLLNTHMGSAHELLVINAVVDTLTEFSEIRKVQILVEGKKIDTIAGHADTSEPFTRNEAIIKKT